jgi:hypothetical protein
VGIRRILFSLTFATALLALASSGASAFVYSSFVCQAVGVRSVDWGRSFFVGDAKMIALGRCARRSGICTISYCVPGYWHLRVVLLSLSQQRVGGDWLFLNCAAHLRHQR